MTYHEKCCDGKKKGAMEGNRKAVAKWEGVTQGKDLYWKEAQVANPGGWENLGMFMKVKEKERQVCWQFGGKGTERDQYELRLGS